MKLSELFENIKYKVIKGDMDIDISDMAYDSRNVKITLGATKDQTGNPIRIIS